MTAAEAMTWGEYALSAMVTYGPVALGLALMFCAAGAPVPGSILLVAAGAFASQGMMAWEWTLLASVAGVILGDNIAYSIGRLGGTWAEDRFGHSESWQSALEQFNRRAAWTVFLTRWLITPIGSVIALIAGIGRFPWPKFLLIGGVGEAIWVAIYWTIGWVLGSQWQTAATFLTDFSGLILGLSLLLIALVIGVRSLLRSHREPAGEEDEAVEGSLAAAEAMPPADAHV